MQNLLHYTWNGQEENVEVFNQMHEMLEILQKQIKKASKLHQQWGM